MSVNKVIVIGNLGANPEVRILPNSGQNVANFSLATTARFKDRNGDQQKRTEWQRPTGLHRGTADDPRVRGERRKRKAQPYRDRCASDAPARQSRER
jgi:single stranded DNA-binding protein